MRPPGCGETGSSGTDRYTLRCDKSGPLDCGYQWQKAGAPFLSRRAELGYAILEGQVKNISSQSLQNVTAVASFYDANGGFITTSDALIDYNPILPGQTSPFKVMKTENPAMNKANVEFKYLTGGSIPFQRATKK